MEEYRYVIGRMDIMPHMWKQNACPIYCPKFSRESLIEVRNLKITVIKEPDALDAEPRN